MTPVCRTRLQYLADFIGPAGQEKAVGHFGPNG